MRLIVYSKALYSTWVYYSPDRILFDCGEGVSSYLENRVFAIKHVFLSHGHADHISGLMGLLNVRNNAMGDQEKELRVYYPAGSFFVSELITYFARTNRNLQYELEWVPLQPGDRVPLLAGRHPRYIEAFATVHARGEPSLGYNVCEVRRRLRPEYRDLPQEEIVALVRAGKKEEISETYVQYLFSYGGDSVPLSPQLVRGTEILLHEATFLSELDRKEYKHSTVWEAIEVAKRAGVQKELILFHLSSRYRWELAELERRIAELNLPFRVRIIPPGEVVELE
ncbi:MAG: MBL fold metallo-hydrolase [Candidatus Bipolaricaulota bacterium]|nr:MBL fold metallo-hydrolase [Candidatus Bipolaricaulota bacterium]MCX7844675.1 MBL fold metallo-hydrolase [Candidatus Bipolaricaulota bacterium]MDW8152527.1 MBL fold metallo-hydrolase [Candidatus Bipolaricaulota bacterium]